MKLNPQKANIALHKPKPKYKKKHLNNIVASLLTLLIGNHNLAKI